MTTYEVTERVVTAAKGNFLTLETMEKDAEGGWHRAPSLHYLREGNCVFQTRIFGRNVLSDEVSESMIEIFDNAPERTHSEVAAQLKALTKPSWR